MPARKYRACSRNPESWIDDGKDLFDVPCEVVEFAPISLVAVFSLLLTKCNWSLGRLINFVKFVTKLSLKLGRVLLMRDVSLDHFEGAHLVAHQQTVSFICQATKFSQFAEAPIRLQIAW